jgi:hypothetical protein
VQAFRTIYRYWLTLLFVAVIAQIAAAAYGAFYAAQKLGDQNGSDEQKMISEKVFDHGFGFHTAFGYFIFLGAVVLLLLALAARLGKRRILFALAVPLAVVGGQVSSRPTALLRAPLRSELPAPEPRPRTRSGAHERRGHCRF